MWIGFVYVLRRYKLSVDARILWEWMEVMRQGGIETLGDLFRVGECLIVHSKQDVGPYILAFWEYFLDISTQGIPRLEDAVQRSAVFQQWLTQQQPTQLDQKLLLPAQVDAFLNEVLQTRLLENLQKVMDGRAWLDQNLANQQDSNVQDVSAPPASRTQPIDYSNISLEELEERMRQVAQQQQNAHQGGRHWIGRYGSSPYGNSGAGLQGIRVGGESYARSARKVIEDPTFFPVHGNAPLTDNSMDAALQSLKKLQLQQTEWNLDVETTVSHAGKQGGIVVPYFKNESTDQTHVILLLDNGGRSMRSHIHQVQVLFQKLKRRFSQDLTTYYFHNSIYDQVYEDEARRRPVSLKRLLGKSPDSKVVVLGDADMAPQEMLSPYGSIEYREESPTPSIENWRVLHRHFPSMVWINPIGLPHWRYTLAPQLQQLFPMFPLTPNGLHQAVMALNQQKPQSYRDPS